MDNVALALESRLAEAHRKLQLVEQENSDLHNILVDSQVSLNEYAQDVEEQMLQVCLLQLLSLLWLFLLMYLFSILLIMPSLLHVPTRPSLSTISPLVPLTPFLLIIFLLTISLPLLSPLAPLTETTRSQRGHIREAAWNRNRGEETLGIRCCIVSVFYYFI